MSLTAKMADYYEEREPMPVPASYKNTDGQLIDVWAYQQKNYHTGEWEIPRGAVKTEYTYLNPYDHANPRRYTTNGMNLFERVEPRRGPITYPHPHPQPHHHPSSAAGAGPAAAGAGTARGTSTGTGNFTDGLAKLSQLIADEKKLNDKTRKLLDAVQHQNKVLDSKIAAFNKQTTTAAAATSLPVARTAAAAASAAAKPPSTNRNGFATSGFGSAGSRSASQAAGARSAASDLIASFRPIDAVCYTDGSCYKNPGPCGSGAHIIVPVEDNRTGAITDYKYSRSVPLGRGTNNIAELYAVAVAVDLLEIAEAEHGPGTSTSALPFPFRVHVSS